MIKSTHDILNHRTGFGGRYPGFEVIWQRLAVSLSWWISWFFNTKGVALIHIYYNNWWEEFKATDDAGISLVYDPSTSFANTLISHAERCNN